MFENNKKYDSCLFPHRKNPFLYELFLNIVIMFVSSLIHSKQKIVSPSRVCVIKLKKLIFIDWNFPYSLQKCSGAVLPLVAPNIYIFKFIIE